MAWTPPAVGTRATWTRTLTSDDVELYARITGDRNPLHFDEGFAAGTKAGRLIVHGGLTTGLFNALVAMELPGPGSVFLHRLGCVARRAGGTEVLRLLALGPAVGIVAMWRLRGRPDATKMANGNR
jgi:acyl dehydratase